MPYKTIGFTPQYHTYCLAKRMVLWDLFFAFAKLLIL